MPLYFAYGSNMDAVAMRKMCPRSTPLGPARLMHHRFAILQAGYATVEPDPLASVHGLLFDVDQIDFPALDRYEGLSVGLYVRLLKSVFRDNGPVAAAFVYLGCGASGGQALPGYMECVAGLARAANFPREYVVELERFVPSKAAPAV